jgi:Rrf2 family transcriptional regulator, iron-sulfur cluster assembly transcription factor
MLSTTAQYALRALSHLAAAAPDEQIRGRELAARSGVPANYLSKLLLTLGNAGLIEANRGTGGGYRLARKPHTVSLAEVVELIDGGVAQPQCLLGLQAVCSDATPCCAHQSWRGAKQAYQDFLHRTTLADIAAQDRKNQAPRPTRVRPRRTA